MSKLSKANYIFAILFLLSLIAAIGNDMRVVNRYGWVYDKTTIIGNDISTETINMNITVWNYLFMGVLLVTLIWNGKTLNNSLIINLDPSEIDDFEFPKGKPEKWHVDIAETFIGVTINEYEIILPRHKIESKEEIT